jgi:phenylacetate-CoA ligase
MTKSQVFKEKIDSLFMRRKFIPAYEISDKNIRRFIAEIEKTNPVLMDGYAESLNFLATYLSSKELKTKPRAIMSSAQILPQQSRDIIERTLGSRVFDKYGSREFSGIAYECEESPGYHHVMDESYILEILVEGRTAKPGEIGEVVITDLNNYSVPLIRYRIGDLAECVEDKACACGRNLKLIGKIQGRTQAIVYCKGGIWMPGTFFAHFFKDYDSVIAQFQIYQAKKDEFELKYMRGPDYTSQGMNRVIKELRSHVGDTDIILREVDEIPLLATGKRSPVVSDIKFDFQNM